MQFAVSNQRRGREEDFECLLQHIELAEIRVDESGLLIHLPHVLDHLQVQLPRLGLRERSVLQQWSWPERNSAIHSKSHAITITP